MNGFRNLLRKPILISAGLLALCAVAYGTLIKTMGLYWDDWPSLWFLHFFGPGVFPDAFSIDRPAQGWLFVLTTSLFGESLFAWQVFGILARWVSGVALGWVLVSLWPKYRLQALGVVILFLVYPGFAQQNIAITYGHQQLVMALQLVSLAAMIGSIRQKERYVLLTAASLLSGLFSMFALEYFFGWELLRPVFLWILLCETIPGVSRRIAETFKRWLPYLVMDLGFLAWRLTHTTPRGEVTLFENLRELPGATLTDLLRTIANDVYEAGVLAWAKAVNTLNLAGVKQSVVFAYLATVLAAALIALVLLLLSKDRRSGEVSTAGSGRWGWIAFLVGLFAMFTGGWSFWVTDLRLELSMPWDRFTQPLMLGACLMIVGLLDLLIRPALPKIILIAALAGVSAGAQFFHALGYRQEWSDQRNFFWQLAWRIPQLEPGTLLLTSQLPFPSSTDNSLSAAINWIYAPGLETRQMPFLLYDIEARLGNRLPSLDPGTPVQQDYRATEFNGSTNQALVFYFSPPRCLKVLDLYTDRHYPNKPGDVVLALPLSNLDLIQAGDQDAAQLPPFLGPEPMHNWCYYFEKVDLAVQLEEWEKAARLADQALKIKPQLTPSNAPELIPLIYAYAHSGRYDKAMELSAQAGKLSSKMHYYTCDTWYYLSKRILNDPAFEASFAEISQKFECSPP